MKVLRVGEGKGGSSTTNKWGDSVGVATCLGDLIAPCGVTNSSSVRRGVSAVGNLPLDASLWVAYGRRELEVICTLWLVNTMYPNTGINCIADNLYR